MERRVERRGRESEGERERGRGKDGKRKRGGEEGRAGLGVGGMREGAEKQTPRGEPKWRDGPPPEIRQKRDRQH